ARAPAAPRAPAVRTVASAPPSGVRTLPGDYTSALPGGGRARASSSANARSGSISGGGATRGNVLPAHTSTSASASAGASPAGTSRPLSPWATSSSMLVPAVPTTGTPSARLSITVFGRLSIREGSTLAAAPDTTP